MDIPQTITDAARAAAHDHPDDVARAVEVAFRAVSRLPDYQAAVDTLVRQAIQEKVYEARHQYNVRVRREAGVYGAPSKVPSDTDAARRVYSSVYGYYVAGKTLGDVLGSELPDLAAAEDARANGHHYNAELLRRLQPLVPLDRTVRSAVNEKRLRALFREVGERYGPAPDQAA